MPSGFVVQRGHGMGGLTWETGKPLRTDDFPSDPRFRDSIYMPIVRADQIRSCLTVPIATASGVVGVIYANQLTVRPFSEALSPSLTPKRAS